MTKRHGRESVIQGNGRVDAPAPTSGVAGPDLAAVLAGLGAPATPPARPFKAAPVADTDLKNPSDPKMAARDGAIARKSGNPYTWAEVIEL